jgi:hypothetical protein
VGFIAQITGGIESGKKPEENYQKIKRRAKNQAPDFIIECCFPSSGSDGLPSLFLHLFENLLLNRYFMFIWAKRIGKFGGSPPSVVPNS